MTAKENIAKIKRNPKIRLFLVLLFLSASYWFFTSLSEVYPYKTFYTINYTNLPKNLYFQETPPNLIPVQIKATGFEIIRQKIFPESISFDLNLFKPLGKHKKFVQPNKHDYSSYKQTKNKTFVRFLSDSLFVYLGKLKTKKVPIVSKIKMHFKPGYKMRNSFQLEPDSLFIKGPEQFIDSIKAIQTIESSLNDIEKDIYLKIELALPKKGINRTYYNTSEIILKAEVAKFTEGTLELAIQLPKSLDGTQLELFPKTATIKYEVAFENYQDINSKSFTISCSYPKDSSRTLDLILVKKPNYIKIYTIDPKEVTYLIQK